MLRFLNHSFYSLIKVKPGLSQNRRERQGSQKQGQGFMVKQKELVFLGVLAA